MKIGLSGPDSVGKTTTIEAVVRVVRAAGHSVNVVSAGDIARQSPYPLVDGQTTESSLWILEALRRAEETAEQSAEFVIADRTPLDVWVFSNMARRRGSIGDRQLRDLEQLIAPHLASFAVLYCALIDPTRPLRPENLPSPDYRGRDTFQEVMLDGVRKFADKTRMVMLPHVETQRVTAIASSLRVH